MKNFSKMKTFEERNKYLEENGIKEGQVYEIKTKSLNAKTKETEESTAYYEVFRKKDGDLALRPDKKDLDLQLVKNNTNSHQVGNAENLAGVSALALLSNTLASNKINAEYQKSGLNDKDFSDFDISFIKKDISSEMLKKRQEIQKQKLKKAKEENKKGFEVTQEDKTKDIYFSSVPDNVKSIFEDKKRNIDNKIYTQKVYEMFKKIASFPQEDRNISNFDKRAFSDIISNMEKTKNDSEKQKKVFNQWVFDNDRSNSDRIINLGNLFEKTHKSDFTGYEKKHNGFTKDQREKNLEAIEKKCLPFMKEQNRVDYIVNPENNKIYDGSTQLALQRNNIMNNYKTDAYASLPELLKQNYANNSSMKMKVSCEIVDLGKDSFGHSHYQILVPVKPSFKERRQMKKEEKLSSKMQKEMRNEEYRRNIQDAKFQKKYGALPQYETAVQPLPLNQPALISNDKISRNYEKPGNESTVEEKLKYDTESYFMSMFTKEPYKPYTNWEDRKNRKEIFDFVQNNPEKYEKILKESYTNVRNQVKANVNANQNVNENVQTDEKENTKTKGRSNGR